MHGDDPERCYGERGGRRGSCLGTHVRIKDFKIKKIKNLKKKKQRHYFADKVHLVKAMVFPVVMYGCESWTIKKAEC